MKIIEFYEAVENDPELIGRNIIEAEELDETKFVLSNTRDDYSTTFQLPVIRENQWTVLRKLALGELEIQPLAVMTRIVGYFSIVSNWNKSKMGELKDRRLGNYGV